MSAEIDRALSKVAEVAVAFSESIKSQELSQAGNMARIKAARELILIRGELSALRIAIQELTDVQRTKG